MASKMNTTLSTDIAIIGGGPAGLAAAVKVREMGLDCILIERTTSLGGQILAVNLHSSTRIFEPEVKIINGLVEKVKRLNLRIIYGARPYRVDRSRQLYLTSGEQNPLIKFRLLLIAVGAREQVRPFRNWTLPGVLTLGAAQRIIIQPGIALGKSVLVAGSGPLMLSGAARLIESGVQVVGVIEATPLYHLGLGGIATLLRYPVLFGRSINLIKTLFISQAQLRWSQVLLSAVGDGLVQGAVTVAVKPDGELDLEHQEAWDVDTICVSDGLLPNLHLYRALDCNLIYDKKMDAYRPVLNTSMQSSQDWVFVAGEAAGIGGAEKAFVEGEIAGIEAALVLNPGKREEYQSRLISLNRKRQRLQGRWDRLQGMFLPIHEVSMQADPDTIICRCEEIPLQNLQQAIQKGDGTLRDLKLRTRLGMGLCQGRQCEHLAHRLLAEGKDIPIQEIKALNIQPPLEPVPLSALIGIDGL